MEIGSCGVTELDAQGLSPMMKYLLWFLGILLTVIGISGNPMLLIYPLWMFTYLNREPLRRLVRDVPYDHNYAR